MRRALVLVGLFLVCAVAPAQAQSSGRSVRIIVPFSAGGAPDVIARVLAQGLAEQTGQSYVVENRPGADGVVGAQSVAQAAPEGLTLL
jgi:tripartite-type tricarboxylate transporter receptor subunit TctC